MTAEAKIKIAASVVGLDQLDALREKLGGLEATTTNTDEAVKDFARSLVGELLPAWTQSADATTFAIGAFKDIAGRIKQVAEDYDQLADIQESLGGATQDLASEMTQGLIPALELAQARGTALAAGLQLTDQQFAAVAVAAQLYAQRTGIDGAQAVDQLSNAIVSGNQRALRPFGIQLQEGATRAEGAAEAIRQLTEASERNAAAIARSTGGLDHLKSGFNAAKEAATTFYGGIINFALDGLHQFGVAVGSLAAALASGDSGSLSSAFFAATDASHTFAERIPVIGQEMAFAARAARDWAASLFGLRRSMSAVTGLEVGRGVSDLFDDEQGGEYQRRRDAARDDRIALAGEQYDAITDALQPQSSGGGGGGSRGDRAGARGAIDWAIRDAEVARLRTNRPGGLGGEQGSVTGNPNRAGNRGGGRGGPNAQGSGQHTLEPGNTGLSRTANLVKNLGDAYEQLGSTATSVLSGLGSAVSEHFEAWSSGKETFNEALASMTADLFKWMGQQALKKAGMEAVEAIAAAARYDFGGAALHAAAAVGFGALAGGSFYVAGQVAPGKSSTHGRDDAGAGRSSTRDLGARGESGGAPVFIFNLAPGAIVGGGDMRATQDWLQQQIREGTERNARIRRAA